MGGLFSIYTKAHHRIGLIRQGIGAGTRAEVNKNMLLYAVDVKSICR